MQLLKERVVIITGGAGLLGSEFARAVVEQGARCIITDIDESRGVALAQKLSVSEHTSSCEFSQMDIVSQRSIDSEIRRIVRKYGGIDAVVNNAYPRNKNYGKKFEDVSYDDFCENVGNHLGGYFLTTQRFAEFFRRQGHGNIISIASIYGVVAPRFDIYDNMEMTMPVEYAAIKAAVIHLMKYCVRYYRGNKIRFNCLAPGGIDDGQPNDFLERYKSYTQTMGMLNAKDAVSSITLIQ